MGRKIPGRKHRGIKDPEKQAATRFEKIKNKINLTPLKPDDQEIPKSLQRLVDLKNKTKEGLFKKKKRKRNSFPNQIPGETDNQLLNRMHMQCVKVIKETEYENKYDVEIQKNKDGEVEAVVKKPKDELEILIKKAKKEQREKKQKKKNKSTENEAPKLTKSQKWQLKKKLKKLKKTHQHDDEFSKYKDQVKFGETVHAPPKLVVPKRVERLQEASRPSKNLLLKSILESNKYLEKKKPTAVIDKKGKRKDLPNALRRQLENQQKEIISKYKELKTKKYVKN